MTTFNYVDYSVNDGVALIKLNDGKMNTMYVESVREWGEAIQMANEDNNVGAILITGEGRAFCAGADMDKLFMPKMRGEVPYEENDPYLGGLGLLSTDWVQLVRESKPIVTAINGVAIGGGITGFLCTDILIASEPASFSFPFAKLGIVAEMCSSHFLPVRVGFGRASEILLTGRSVSSEEALDIGLVDYLFPADTMLTEAHKIAASIAANPTPMLRMTKQLLTANSHETNMSEVWRRESDALRQCFGMQEHKDAVEQFLSRGKKK